MKIVAIVVGLVLLALIASTLLPATPEVRLSLTAGALVAAVALLAIIATGWRAAAPAPVAVRPPVAGRPAPAAPPPAVPVVPPPPAVAPPAPVAANQAEAEVVAFLATLQEKGRFVDFVMDDLSAYPDAQVGAVARIVHEGCRAVLQEQFHIQPVREEDEGTKVVVAPGYRADEYRLVGKISGQAPFSGTLMHRGWKTASVKLPRVIRTGDDELPTIAPAEVELQPGSRPR
jgi:hypothetical protein